MVPFAVFAGAASRTFRKTAFGPNTRVIVLPIAVLLLTSGAASIIFNQPLSIFRYFVFTSPLIILVVMSAWYFATGSVSRNVEVANAVAIVLVSGALVNMCWVREPGASPRFAAPFILGSMSFAQGFAARQADWPELVEAKQYIGLEERIMALNNSLGVGAVPGRLVESDINYGYREWHQMVFGQPEAAQAAFQQEGINYFVFDLSRSFTWALPHSPLFTPSTINDYFDVILVKGTTYLLTWKKGGGKEGSRLPQYVVDSLERITQSRATLPGLYRRMKSYFDRNKGAAYPVTSDPSLPSVEGWQ
jgi:hypothetical protein